MNRQRGLLLTILLIVFCGVSSWILYSLFQARSETFLTGAPPKEIQDVIVPKELDVSQLHPPALLSTDFLRFGGVTSTAAVIEYGDFECEDCKAMSSIINKVVSSYKGKIRYVWRDFPITTQHRNAVAAAVFARCAGAQNHFWDAYDKLMAAKGLSEITFASIENSLELNKAQFAACRRDQRMTEAVMHDIDVARGDGFSKAPTIFVGTKAFIGPMKEEELRAAIEAFLKS